jgi:hypothetical protein
MRWFGETPLVVPVSISAGNRKTAWNSRGFAAFGQ